MFHFHGLIESPSMLLGKPSKCNLFETRPRTSTYFVLVTRQLLPLVVCSPVRRCAQQRPVTTKTVPTTATKLSRHVMLDILRLSETPPERGIQSQWCTPFARTKFVTPSHLLCWPVPGHIALRAPQEHVGRTYFSYLTRSVRLLDVRVPNTHRLTTNTHTHTVTRIQIHIHTLCGSAVRAHFSWRAMSSSRSSRRRRRRWLAQSRTPAAGRSRDVCAYTTTTSGKSRSHCRRSRSRRRRRRGRRMRATCAAHLTDTLHRHYGVAHGASHRRGDCSQRQSRTHACAEDIRCAELYFVAREHGKTCERNAQRREFNLCSTERVNDSATRNARAYVRTQGTHIPTLIRVAGWVVNSANMLPMYEQPHAANFPLGCRQS